MWSPARTNPGPITIYLVQKLHVWCFKTTSIILFADDTKMCCSASNIDDVTNVVNNELKQLGLWFKAKKSCSM